MLIEIRCNEFISNGAQRPPIVFHAGLNAVQGSETGSNSIGKSTFLMIIDFAFGGDDYVLKSTDVQKQVGRHVVKFCFEFAEKKHYFSRDTIEHTTVSRCDADYNPIAEMSLDDFRKSLFSYYDIHLSSISFRAIIGLYFRIYGRDNLNEKKPLHRVPAEKPKDAITTLLKLFNRYAPIAELQDAEEKEKKKKDAFKQAQEYHFIPRITKQKLADNEKLIAELESELSALAESSGQRLLQLDSAQADQAAELKENLTVAKRQRRKLNSQLSAVESNLAFNNPQLQSGFDDLLKFFPDINIKGIDEIEQFHRQLVTVLTSEFEEAKSRLLAMIASVENEIAGLEQEIKSKGVPPRVSRIALEDYSSKRGKIKTLQNENETYAKMQTLVADVKTMTERLQSLQAEQIGFLQNEINVRMDKLNDYVYSGEKKAPVLTINKPNSYTFQTPDDTGTGTSYKGLVVFDLSILELTVLPALVHDSVILKQIADEPLEKILELYQKTQKQVFIALDKKGSYTPRTQEILAANTVLHLSDNGNELFGRSWNVK